MRAVHAGSAVSWAKRVQRKGSVAFMDWDHSASAKLSEFGLSSRNMELLPGPEKPVPLVVRRLAVLNTMFRCRAAEMVLDMQSVHCPWTMLHLAAVSRNGGNDGRWISRNVAVIMKEQTAFMLLPMMKAIVTLFIAWYEQFARQV